MSRPLGSWTDGLLMDPRSKAGHDLWRLRWPPLLKRHVLLGSCSCRLAEIDLSDRLLDHPLEVPRSALCRELGQQITRGDISPCERNQNK